MTIGKTIKSLRASGRRNNSPIKRGGGGPADEDSVPDAAGLERRGLNKMGSALGVGAAGSAIGGTGAGSWLGIDKAKRELGRGPIGKVGKGVTGSLVAVGSALAAEAMKRAGSGAGDLAEAARLRKSPPTPRPPEPERKSGGRAGKRK